MVRIPYFYTSVRYLFPFLTCLWSAWQAFWSWWSTSRGIRCEFRCTWTQKDRTTMFPTPSVRKIVIRICCHIFLLIPMQIAEWKKMSCLSKCKHHVFSLNVVAQFCHFGDQKLSAKSTDNKDSLCEFWSTWTQKGWTTVSETIFGIIVEQQG